MENEALSNEVQEKVVPENETSTDKIGKAERVFTQEEVSRMMAKEKREGKLSVLRELGIEDVKSAKDGLKKYQEYVDSQKTEAQKAQEEVQRLAQEKAEAEEQAQLASIQVSALKSGIAPDFLDDAIVLAKNKKTDNMTFEEVFNSLKEQYPNFAGAAQVTQPKGTGSMPKPTTTNNNTKENDFGKRLAEARLAEKQAVKSAVYFKED